jgi:hypothetical protein
VPRHPSFLSKIKITFLDIFYTSHSLSLSPTPSFSRHTLKVSEYERNILKEFGKYE